MRIFMFYCNTSSYSRMLPFYFLLLGVSPNLINPNVSYVLSKPFQVFEMTEQQAAKNRCDWTKKQIVEYKNSFGSEFSTSKILNAQVKRTSAT